MNFRLFHGGEKWYVENVIVECDRPKTKWEFNLKDWIGKGKGLKSQQDIGLTRVTDY